jgi:hypothetical protein
MRDGPNALIVSANDPTNNPPSCTVPMLVDGDLERNLNQLGKICLPYGKQGVNYFPLS